MTIADPLKSKQPIKNRKNRKKQSKLLNAACAGLLGAGMVSACGTANADTLDESSVAGMDFGDTFSAANVLQSGVDRITGEIEAGFPAEDYFRWNDLVPGTTFTGTGSITGGHFRLLNSAEAELDTDEDLNTTINMSTTVPLDGVIVGNFRGIEGNGPYDLTVNASFVPEPGSATFLSLGAAGLLGMRRRKS